ncbi:MAG: FAD-binding oxidoreductase [archaeon]|nr:FAD-binding oxidoreductase [archaeon]
MAALSESTIAIIKATAPAVAPRALDITKTFYPIMFRNNPEVLQFFNKTNQAGGSQPEALANAVVAYASNIDKLENLATAVEIIVHKHCGLEVLPEHYAIVEKNLLLAIGEVLGPILTPEIVTAWTEAVHALSVILIAREEQLYAAAAARAGGFRSWRDFVIVEKSTIADRTTFLKFKPADGSNQQFDFVPGQFLTIQCDVGESYPAKRHYTVVSAPGEDHLAIAVRSVPARNAGVPPGLVSNTIAQRFQVGDIVKLMPPFGAFRAMAEELAAGGKQVLAVSAGIGITPIQSFLREFRRAGCAKVVAVHQDHAPTSHPFAESASLADQSFVRYSTAVTEFAPSGRLDQADFQRVFEKAGLVPAQTVAFCCGPPSFMLDCSRYLKEIGVSAFHAEFFGPQLSTRLAL